MICARARGQPFRDRWSVSLAECWRSARRNWWLPLVCALVAAGTALYLTQRQEDEYRSSLRLAVGPSPTLSDRALVADAVNALNKRSLIATFAEIAGGRVVFHQAADSVGLSAEEASRYSVSSAAMPEANVIMLDVEGPDPAVAGRLANAVGAKSIAFVDDFYKTYALRALDDAGTSSDPVSPKPGRDAPVAAAGGLCLGFLLGLGRDFVRGRRRVEEVAP
jgi:capsular polysaccharide biosynthesis protein